MLFLMFLKTASFFHFMKNFIFFSVFTVFVHFSGTGEKMRNLRELLLFKNVLLNILRAKTKKQMASEYVNTFFNINKKNGFCNQITKQNV